MYKARVSRYDMSFQFQAVGCFVRLEGTIYIITDIRWLCGLHNGVLSQVGIVHHTKGGG